MASQESVADARKRLEELRDKLAAALEGCSENMLPQLSGQYRATLADLLALKEPETVDNPIERAKSARAARRADLKVV